METKELTLQHPEATKELFLLKEAYDKLLGVYKNAFEKHMQALNEIDLLKAKLIVESNRLVYAKYQRP